MKVLILDIDNTLNTEDPKVILKTAEKLGYGKYSQDVWNLFEESARDMNVKPHPIPFKNYSLFDELFDKIIIISSRVSKWKIPSQEWLEKYGFHYDHLFLREAGDYSKKSGTVKKDIIKKKVLKLYPHANIVTVDDDEGVVKVYQEFGFKVFVAPHEWSDFLKYVKIELQNKKKGVQNAVHKTRRQTSVRRSSKASR